MRCVLVNTYLRQPFFQSSKHLWNLVYVITFICINDLILIPSILAKRKVFKYLFRLGNRKSRMGSCPANMKAGAS